MAYLVDTPEGRLQMRLGQLMFENEMLRHHVEKLEAALEEEKARRESDGEAQTDA